MEGKILAYPNLPGHIPGGTEKKIEPKSDCPDTFLEGLKKNESLSQTARTHSWRDWKKNRT